MTDKPQQGSQNPAEHVSRETVEGGFTGTPDRTAQSPENSGQDLLNEIMDRAMAKTAGPPPEPEKPNGETSNPDKKPSTPPKGGHSVFVYLAVLFGAAFLMLLLAYFVQQRNNTAAMDDLRISSTASRQELLDEIERLEKENEDLQKDVDLKQYTAEQARGLYESARQETDEYREWLYNAQSQLTKTTILWYLERFINEGDYLMASVVVDQNDHYFNENNWNTNKIDALSTQVTRYMELRDWLSDNGHILIKIFDNPPDRPREQPVIAAEIINANDEAMTLWTAARNLLTTFLLYSLEEAEPAAHFTALLYHPDMGNLEYLNTDNFKPSTIAQLEEIKADLLNQGLLKEQDGILYYAHDGRLVDVYGTPEVIGGTFDENFALPESMK